MTDEQYLDNAERTRLCRVFTGMAFGIETLVLGLGSAINGRCLPIEVDTDVAGRSRRLLQLAMEYRRMADAVQPKQPAEGSDT